MGAGPGSARLPTSSLPTSSSSSSSSHTPLDSPPLPCSNYWEPLTWRGQGLGRGVSSSQPFTEEVECGLGRGVSPPKQNSKAKKAHFLDEVNIMDIPELQDDHETDLSPPASSTFGHHEFKAHRHTPKCSKLKVPVVATFQDGSSKSFRLLWTLGLR